MVVVNQHITFYNPNKVPHKGYYLDGYLKDNFDGYFIKAVKHKWDGVILITGMEGSGKSIGTFTYAHYTDNTFPGENGERIVFTPDQFMKAVDKSKPGQAIVWDEFVLGGLSTDAMTSMQRLVLQKMTLIRKKGLFIFLVVPSIFLLQRYFAIHRTRALIHFYSLDGISRGTFKFYNYQSKRKLYMKGKKEWNQGAVRPDFIGRATNTEGYFIDVGEYDRKKEEAILYLTEEPKRKKQELSNRYKRITTERDILVNHIYQGLVLEHGTFTYQQMADYLKDKFGCDYTDDKVGKCIRNAIKLTTDKQ